MVRLCFPVVGSLLSLPLYVLFVAIKCDLKFIEVFLLFASQLNGLVLKQAADERAQSEVDGLSQVLEVLHNRIESIDYRILLDQVV